MDKIRSAKSQFIHAHGRLFAACIVLLLNLHSNDKLNLSFFYSFDVHLFFLDINWFFWII